MTTEEKQKRFRGMTLAELELHAKQLQSSKVDYENWLEMSSVDDVDRPNALAELEEIENDLSYIEPRIHQLTNIGTL